MNIDGVTSNNAETAPNEPHKVVILFANFINYLNVSLYEGRFTQKHEQARANLNAIYDCVSKTPDKPPALEQCVSFYNDVRMLEKVTDTEDPIYYTYKRLLRVYIAETTPFTFTLL
jgi:hypothetical protein